MAEERNIDLQSAKTYKVNSIPCRIRYTGPHSSIPKHLIKIQENQEIITYLRGRKLHGKSITNIKGVVLAKDDMSDEIKSLGQVNEVQYYEREGVSIDQVEKIDEFVKLSELIHG
ncbi:hypothetical protein BN7_2730 [Wickerhamomyces ciferrii]|uniref:Uncharacterized protein n=1 Tax=Wickerhamomyces ciferrii (strain ATCC 14091 / BCRC 22168 / CBS 111 / JCM 3599 / NBRC 0793 / NRRL Y-1031 F-60-10) TaxID=1206466 RepID=K0KPT6_WICCF|nr:uncharacterized protein BN7_2730 [Wickerhamomyces ciferrii]CCH43183.1 hypothetical protein BN7_2730 [Wickerhamomyces ciferrii]